MRLRQMAVAFLMNEDEQILFLQKKEKSAFLPGMLVPIGGHMETAEMNEPKVACLREVKEETGLRAEDIHHLTLKYIVLRMKGIEEIRMQYVFFGHVTKARLLLESDEGKLSWQHQKVIRNTSVTATTKEIIHHYRNEQKNEQVYVGTMKANGENPAITWALLEDWETFHKNLKPS
ncbi:NUDIX domain-containing protein [Alkalihalobacillus sp. 1P02AB]|uniref:NUDIX domain-containing protein n=1 Tax=Alkalihalobacillus sp. 1P02AB TaxID=3132260 RepID=UPI0039A40C71